MPTAVDILESELRHARQATLNAYRDLRDWGELASTMQLFLNERQDPAAASILKAVGEATATAKERFLNAAERLVELGERLPPPPAARARS